MPANDEDLGDLTPGDGLSDHFIEVDGLDNLGQGHVAVRFRVFTWRDGVQTKVAWLSFPVAPQGDRIEGQIARAYDELILALRQCLLQAARARRQYRTSSVPSSPSGTG